jgi:hypothetical protein
MKTKKKNKSNKKYNEKKQKLKTKNLCHTNHTTNLTIPS